MPKSKQSAFGFARARVIAATTVLAYVSISQSAATSPAASEFHPYSVAAVPGILRIKNKSYILPAALWKNPNVPVCWEPHAPGGVEREWVKDAVEKSWNSAHSRLRFFGFGICADEAKGIRIGVRDVSPDDGPHTSGLGNELSEVKSGMILNFTFKTWSPGCAVSDKKREDCIRSIAVHEFGHAAGFAHEQNRPDTPGECAKPAQGPNGVLMLTPWDLSSVMNYCNPIYSNSGVLSKLDGDTLRDPQVYGPGP
jgi:hypothetical protein